MLPSVLRACSLTSLLGDTKVFEKEKVGFMGGEEEKRQKKSACAKEHLAFNLVVSKVHYG